MKKKTTPPNTIPGQLSELDKQAIVELASQVPKNGCIVEIGSLYGLSSWHWAKSADPTVTVHCIDPWEHAAWMDKVKAEFDAPDLSPEVFAENVKDCPNITQHKGYSPKDFLDWSEPVDLFFDDAVHTNPIFLENLQHWGKLVKSGGIVSGHDFDPNHYDIMTEVSRLAKRWKTELHVLGAVWWIKKP
ncbi:class I SAM-dependent methyltransferase [Roseovarius indicus]